MARLFNCLVLHRHKAAVGLFTWPVICWKEWKHFTSSTGKRWRLYPRLPFAFYPIADYMLGHVSTIGFYFLFLAGSFPVDFQVTCDLHRQGKWPNREKGGKSFSIKIRPVPQRKIYRCIFIARAANPYRRLDVTLGIGRKAKFSPTMRFFFKLSRFKSL